MLCLNVRKGYKIHNRFQVEILLLAVSSDNPEEIEFVNKTLPLHTKNLPVRPIFVSVAPSKSPYIDNILTEK
jgi:hypothetical protein